MAWFHYRPFSNAFEWFWRKLCLLWRYVGPMFRPLLTLRLNRLKNLRGLKDEGEEKRPETDLESTSADRVERPAGREPEHGVVYSCDEDEEEIDSEKYRVDSTDEFYCSFDSTWEAEKSTSQRSRRHLVSRHVCKPKYKFNRFENAARDMQKYRHGYPNKPQHWIKPISDEKPNLNFYLGLKPSEPDGLFIHDFHNKWAGDYDRLEYVHTYIQWLFPLQEPGMNYAASPLTKEEIKCFLENSTAKENLLRSYKLMLDFYGIELSNEKTGDVTKAWNWIDRFKNLNNRSHNNLRITRILKCLGTLGYPHYQAPLVHFFLRETLVDRQLPNVKDSVLNYFLFAVLDKKQRRKLIQFAYFNYDSGEEFVWCPKKIQRMWSQLSHTGATEESPAF